MPPDPLLDRIRSSPRITELLWELGEFAPLEGAAPDWFRLEPEAPLEVVGRDAGGGRFCLAGEGRDEARPLLYITSEGQAGRIANSLAEGLGMMIALPYWRDCLQFSGGGDLEQMRRAEQQLEADLRKSHPDLDARRQELSSGLDIPLPAAPLVALLRSAQQSGAHRVVAATDGYPFGGLLGTSVL